MFEEWRKLEKSATRHTDQAHKSKVKSTLDNLFDTAYHDTWKNINEEDWQLLLFQRNKGCSICMGGVDVTLLRAEERRTQRKAAEMIRLEKLKL